MDATINRLTRPQLQSLIAVSEHPSFDAAARSLKISQPSLHRSARELERELRRSLYRRTATGVTTTPYGSELARRVQVALGEIEYGLDEIQAARGNIVSQIVIGNIPHSATQILSNAIKKFLSKYPTARMRIVDGHYENLLNELRAGKLDLLYGVLRRPPTSRKSCCSPITTSWSRVMAIRCSGQSACATGTWPISVGSCRGR
jgi:DNA-binding transcriptional LysR family regulator